MQRDTVLKLNQLNRSFYSAVATAFDQTRQTSWAGWQNLLTQLRDFDSTKPLKVLDVGCGNGRFLDFLVKNLPNQAIEYTGIDLNPDLLNFAKERTKDFSAKTHWQQFDLVQTWLDGSTIENLHTPPFDTHYDLIVAFGVMHHIPSAQQRFDWLHFFQKHIAPGGVLAVADWQFTRENDRFAQKTIAPEKLGFASSELESNDYFLNWQQGKVSYRYCHETTKQERVLQNEALAANNPGFELSEYDADGKSGQLNHYRVWHSKKL